MKTYIKEGLIDFIRIWKYNNKKPSNGNNNVNKTHAGITRK